MMDRVFESKREDGTVERTADRVYFKMKSDRTMKIYKRENRPKFEMFKVEQDEEGSRKKKKKRLFEKGDESMSSAEEQFHKKDVEDSFYDVDGTWWWQDAAPLNGTSFYVIPIVVCLYV